MSGYTVETLAVSGKWVPFAGCHRIRSLFAASVDTFEARLIGQRSRIVEWPIGKVVVEVPPLAVHVSNVDQWRLTPVLRKLWGAI